MGIFFGNVGVKIVGNVFMSNLRVKINALFAAIRIKLMTFIRFLLIKKMNKKIIKILR